MNAPDSRCVSMRCALFARCDTFQKLVVVKRETTWLPCRKTLFQLPLITLKIKAYISPISAMFVCRIFLYCTSLGTVQTCKYVCVKWTNSLLLLQNFCDNYDNAPHFFYFSHLIFTVPSSISSIKSQRALYSKLWLFFVKKQVRLKISVVSQYFA